MRDENITNLEFVEEMVTEVLNNTSLGIGIFEE